MSSLSHISIDMVPAVLQVLWKSKKVAMIWGPPGVGKSEVIKGLADEQEYTIPDHPELVSKFPNEFKDICGNTFVGRRVYDNRLLLMNPTDLKGLPVYNRDKEEAEWLVTNNLPMSKSKLDELIKRVLDGDEHTDRLLPRIVTGLHDQFSVIFMDELSLAPKLVQGAALQLVLDRSLGEYVLPDAVDIVAAGNRVEDKVGATSMSPALVSRMTHVHIDEPTYNRWRDWAMNNGVCSEVLGFLNFKSEALFDFDAKSISARTGSSSFPTPRTWAFASQIYTDAIATFDKSDASSRLVMDALLAGTIGEATAADFMAWVDIYVHLPDPEDVLNGKIKSIDYEKVVRDVSADGEDRSMKSRALSLKFAFLMSLISKLQNNFTEERGEYAATFMLTDRIDDAEWAMMLLNKVTMHVIVHKKAGDEAAAALSRLIKDNTSQWFLMNKKLSAIVNSQDLAVTKAG
jgi:hypothetical protein